MATSSRDPSWLRSASAPPRTQSTSVWVAKPLLERWRRVEASSGRIINASTLFAEALEGALTVLEAEIEARKVLPSPKPRGGLGNG